MIRLTPQMLVALAIIAGVIWVYIAGIGAERDRIIEENRDAEIEADASSLGANACFDTPGMFWDFGAGQCRRGTPNHR